VLSAAPRGSVAGLGGWPSRGAGRWFSCSTSRFDGRSDGEACGEACDEGCGEGDEIVGMAK